MLLGERSVRFKAQNQKDLRLSLKQQATLFSDPAFPPVDAVLGESELPPDIVWKRPKDVSENPRLFVEVEKWSTIKGGALSCNWFVSAISVLAGLNQLRNKVIPDYWEQEVGEKYCGLFHFKFWRFGVWQEVVVDDFLPTCGDELIVTQSTSKAEFWPALLEKAYAKLHGGYESLREGDLSDALVDFTGGVSEVIDLQAEQYVLLDDKRNQFMDMLVTEAADHSIICFTMAAPAESDIGSRTELGLVRGHTYHMTDVRRVYLGETSLRRLFKGREKVSMMRLRNLREDSVDPPNSPDSAVSGESSPYAFSTSALSRLKSRLSEWQRIKDSERQRLGLLTRDQYEFWMPLEDVVAEFSEAVVIRLVTENLFALGRKWKGCSQTGKWEPGPTNRSGGGTPDSESFLNNPQYLVDMNTETEIILQLMQFHSVITTQSPSDRMHFLIGFHIIKVEDNRNTRVHKLWPHQETVVSQGHKRRREVTYRGRLPSGRHLVLPSTYREGDSAMFLLRLVSTTQLSLRELKEDIPKKLLPCSCFMAEIEWVTVITVKKAENLGCTENDPWQSTNVNPYCVITCEGDKVKTGIAKNDSQPLWNVSFIFYRKKPNSALHIQVYTHNSLLRDRLLGECDVPASVTHGQTDLSLTLRPRLKENETPSSDLPPPTTGTLHITVLTEDNLLAI